jgi:hypothetical protein
LHRLSSATPERERFGPRESECAHVPAATVTLPLFERAWMFQGASALLTSPLMRELPLCEAASIR